VLRTTEQNTLLNAATAYMNLLQTAAILELQRSNVNVLEVTLRQTRDRFTAGEVTRTDVAQAEVAPSRRPIAAVAGRVELRHAQAQYQQVIGVPRRRGSRPPPPSIALAAHARCAIARGRTEHR